MWRSQLPKQQKYGSTKSRHFTDVYRRLWHPRQQQHSSVHKIYRSYKLNFAISQTWLDNNSVYFWGAIFSSINGFRYIARQKLKEKETRPWMQRYKYRCYRIKNLSFKTHLSPRGLWYHLEYLEGCLDFQQSEQWWGQSDTDSSITWSFTNNTLPQI